MGQKMLATDQADLSLMEVRVIEFEKSEADMTFDTPESDVSAALNLTSDAEPKG
jgi:hypothetical protein